MKNSKLNIIAVEKKEDANSPRKVRREEAREKFEALWSSDPTQFNPMRNAMEKERIERTWDLIQKNVALSGTRVVDLGCGYAIFSHRAAKQGAQVDALDIAKQALRIVEEMHLSNIKPIQDYVPNTYLNDEQYDLVIGTDIIACLRQDDYRLFFSELARIVKPHGYTVCSTSIDIYSEDALQRFGALAETEFKIDKWVFSYHALYIRMSNFLKLPEKYGRAERDAAYREEQLSTRRSIGRLWFRISSAPVIGKLWSVIGWILKPLNRAIEQSRWLLIQLENICRFISSDSGISHAIFIGQRKTLIQPIPEEEQPIERKHRKQVWE